MKTPEKLTVLFGLLICVSGCVSSSRQVFSGRMDTWDSEARKLDLPHRYNAFRYGITKLDPPAMLIDPTADYGVQMVDYMEYKNLSHPDDKVMIATLRVYRAMKDRNIYNICLDKRRLYQAERSTDLLKDEYYRGEYKAYLSKLCSSSSHL